MDKYYLGIIGSGPCGYVAAIRAAQSGIKVCVFEKDRIGGVCLNWGCIPAKALSAASHVLYNIQRAEEFGIKVKGYDLDFSKVYARKEAIVKKLASGIEAIFKARKIDIVCEKAVIKDNARILAGNREIETDNILIATGSVPFELQDMRFDSTHILSSTDMLSLKEVPASLVIVGGGVIGCEFASIFRLFGSDITIIEMMDQLLPGEDVEIAKKLEQIFRKNGIKVLTKTKVERTDKKDSGIKCTLSDGSVIDAEKALVCVGRKPNAGGFGLEEAGVELYKGCIKVDENFRTSIHNVYAAGDVKGGILLAHVASREGIAAVGAMLGKKAILDYNIVPNCIFTQPEIAGVGLNGKRAKAQGINARPRKFLFSAIGKAYVLGETEGFIKLVVNGDDDKIIGAQIIGPHATELIAEISPCIQFGITSEKLAGVIHAHPTLSEIIHEAAESAHDRAIHSL